MRIKQHEQSDRETEECVLRDHFAYFIKDEGSKEKKERIQPLEEFNVFITQTHEKTHDEGVARRKVVSRGHSGRTNLSKSLT